MINSKAFVPSDILTASNGKTIEGEGYAAFLIFDAVVRYSKTHILLVLLFYLVLNTDAEGRLTLADALVFADEECGCEKIIELSTLTGACMVSKIWV